MAVSYNMLCKLLVDKGITKTGMQKMAYISTNVFAKIRKTKAVSMNTLAKITAILHRSIYDIVRVTACNETEGE